MAEDADDEAGVRRSVGEGAGPAGEGGVLGEQLAAVAGGEAVLQQDAVVGAEQQRTLGLGRAVQRRQPPQLRAIGCGQRCEEAAGSSDPGPARVSLDRKGRGGKSVTVIEGLGLSAESLRQLAKDLKRRSGTGGSVKAGRIEIQGDQRDLVVSELQARGHEVRRVGG